MAGAFPDAQKTWHVPPLETRAKTRHILWLKLEETYRMLCSLPSVL
jgi:hypothetical protein